jgi:hypothetical protein
MKIYLPPMPTEIKTPLMEAFNLAGMNVVFSLNNLGDGDFVYFGKNNFYYFYSNLPKKFLTNINLNLIVKDKMMDECQNAGINIIPSYIIEDENTILNFSENNIFIKPSESAAQITPYTFVYKTYTSKTELLSDINQECPNFFSIDEVGISISKKHIIQRAFLPESDGFTHQYFVAGLINGQGEIYKDGIARTKLAFNPLNDVDDITYPNRYLRAGSLRNLEDTTDKFEIYAQLQKLVDFYNIRNTPFACQFMLDENNKSYLLDFNYNFQRGFHLNENVVSREEFADKIKFMYDLQPDIKMPLTGYTCLVDFLIESDIQQTIDYAKTLGIYTTDAWVFSNSPNAKTKTFVCRGTSEEDILNRIEQVKTYIQNNKIV